MSELTKKLPEYIKELQDKKKALDKSERNQRYILTVKIKELKKLQDDLA